MDMQTGEEVPPKSTDLAGWRQAIATDRLKLFRLEALVAAFQDLGDRDHRHLHFRIFPCAKMVIMRRRSVFSLLVYREPVTIYRLAVRPVHLAGKYTPQHRPLLAHSDQRHDGHHSVP